ncbi:TRAP transporter substrate-binding protein [Bengtsoniella intestinalis]|uniref:TRAP transporter substrate-binding protein n=1 Tax=Bengtsoniella intestinalis TaxID=3073143 RepID=UPI00391F4419
MKKLLALFMASAMMLSLVACSSSSSSATSTSSSSSSSSSTTEVADPIVLKMGFNDPDTSPYVQGGQKIAELVAEATDGQIQIEVYSSGALGDERAMVEMAMDGSLDIATCANSVMTNFIPEMGILDQAYLWKNADEAHAAVDGELGELVKEEARALGMEVIGFLESGFRNTFSTEPILSMEDYSGVTIRVMENAYHQAAFESFGAMPIVMSYNDVFTALQQGTIDACENATANCLNSGYYEVTKHVTNSSHAFVYILMCMSESAWNKIPEELQEPFMAAVQEGVEYERALLVQSNEEATVELMELGVEFHDIDVAELQAAYQAKVAEKGFTFDSEWEDAVQAAIASVA